MSQDNLAKSLPQRTRAEVVSHFSEVATSGRGNYVSGFLYIVISEADKRACPELAECFGIAIQQAGVQGGTIQFFIFRTQAEFDDDVLAGLSGTPFSRCQGAV
jgi:hypothetical protein